MMDNMNVKKTEVWEEDEDTKNKHNTNMNNKVRKVKENMKKKRKGT